MPYEQLDADQIVATIDTLHRRIVERFPTAGLGGVCQKLLDIARGARERSAEIARPIYSVRFLSALVIGVITIATAWIAWIVLQGESAEIWRSSELIQAL